MDKTKQIPVIIITSRSDKATLARALQLGAAEFIVKPFSRGVITSKLKNIKKLDLIPVIRTFVYGKCYV